jgi:hypothetical protein
MKKQFKLLLIAIFFAAALKAQGGIKLATDTSKEGRANDRIRNAGPKDGWGQPSNNDNIPPATLSGFKQIAAKHRTGVVDYLSVENELKKSGIDFSNMPIEDAVMMMFMLIADDARKDMKDMLKEMEATRQKRAALRESEELLKKEIDSLKDRARNQYRSDSLQTKENINLKLKKLQQYSIQEREIMAAENKVTTDRTVAEKHILSVEEAIKKLQQLQFRKKSQ